MSMFPNGRKPHAIIQSLMARTRPKSSKFKKGGGVEDAQPGGELGASATKASGTAGYLFFQNADGFVFKSMDLLCSDGSDTFGGSAPVAEYYSRPAAGQSSESAFNTIESYKFTDEIDIIDKLNNGIYSTHMCYFDLSSQKYEEYNYDMKTTFNNMSHLGSQTSVPKYQKDLSAKPSRIMTALLILNYGMTEMVLPTQKKMVTQSFLTMQSITQRSQLKTILMENQKVEVVIPGNSSLRVGDKVKIYIPNVAAEEIREGQQWDEENSGTYLIAQLSHNYQLVKESGEPEFTTVLNLIRDTYGIKEYDSGVK